MIKFDNDSPIEHPDDDKLKNHVFAEALAKCILGIKDPKGGVIAVHGPWGSGKSSVINLVLHKLDESPDRPAIIKFNSWCYRSEEGVVAGFFQEFYTGLKSEVRDTSINIDSLLKLGSRLTGAVKMASPVLDATIPGVGKIVSAGSDLIEKSISENQTIDSLQKRVSKELEMAGQKILIVIDDIDRLSPQEAIAIFRIIKSVGRLNNVTYLLAYDRVETEKMINDKLSVDGIHYLEKIVQASFDLPNPIPKTISSMLDEKLNEIFENKKRRNFQFSDDRIQEIVVPEIKTVRDMHRLGNILSVTFPVVEDDVNVEDFVSLETIRLFHPYVYKEIRENGSILTEPRKHSTEKRQLLYDKINETCENLHMDSSRVMRSITKLFPALNYDFETIRRRAKRWDLEQRLCSPLHFDTYFRFFVSDEIISNKTFQEFISNASNRSYVEARLDRKGKPETAYTEEKISFLLEKIEYEYQRLNSVDVEPFLITLCQISKSFRYGNRQIVDRLIRSIVLSRRDIDISAMMLAVCNVAPLDLLVSICHWAYVNRHTRYNEETETEESIVEKDVVLKIREIALKKAKLSVDDDSILEYPNMLHIIYDWDDIVDDTNEIPLAFKNMLGRSSENVILAARRFSVLFPLDVKDDSRHENRVEVISSFIDVRDFIMRLEEVVEDCDDDEREYVSNLLKILTSNTPNVEEDDDIDIEY